jgi:hypothetical protein
MTKRKRANEQTMNLQKTRDQATLTLLKTIFEILSVPTTDKHIMTNYARFSSHFSQQLLMAEI